VVLVYDRAPQDPRVARLSDAAFMFWVGAIGICNKWRRDTLAVDELQEELSGRREYDLEACLAELVDAELAHRLPHAHVLRWRASTCGRSTTSPRNTSTGGCAEPPGALLRPSGASVFRDLPNGNVRSPRRS